MTTLDLQPLTKETIDKMGFNNHDLWLIKIGQNISGPYEAQTLKDYASQNEEIFDGALACRLDTGDYQPFWSHALFGRRSPQVIKHEPHQGAFWLMQQGQKNGPHSFHDIDKKIEMGLLSVTEHISTDDGVSWKKIYEIEGLDRRVHSAEELPHSPLESSFHKAKLELIDKLDRPHVKPEEDLASLAHQGQKQGKILTLKLDELTIGNLHQPEVSQAMKWSLPVAMALVVTIVTGGYFSLNPSESPIVAQEEVPKKIHEVKAPNPSAQLQRPVPVMAKPEMPVIRRPASVAPSRPEARAYNQDERYPTEIETHTEFHQDERERYPADEPRNDMAYDDQPREVEEAHSLVSQPRPQEDDYSLDAAMNGVIQPVDPIIEEASDF